MTERAGPGRPLTPLPEAEMVHAYQTGMSTAALARLYGVGKETVRRRLHSLGIPMRETGARAGYYRSQPVTK